jgi:Uma2 family endonuclease
MCDNTRKSRCIITIKDGLEWYLREAPDVLVAAGLLWYPVEGDPSIRQAPDVMVVEGRPRGERGSYKQWEEGGVAPQVVFDVRPSGPWHGELIRKWKFYTHFGVEEHYVYDPEHGHLDGWLRQGGQFVEVPDMGRWVSPRLKCTFMLEDRDFGMCYPDGSGFRFCAELAEPCWIREAQ